MFGPLFTFDEYVKTRGAEIGVSRGVDEWEINSPALIGELRCEVRGDEKSLTVKSVEAFFESSENYAAVNVLDFGMKGEVAPPVDEFDDSIGVVVSWRPWLASDEVCSQTGRGRESLERILEDSHFAVRHVGDGGYCSHSGTFVCSCIRDVHGSRTTLNS
jgi:hypothetical protein